MTKAEGTNLSKIQTIIVRRSQLKHVVGLSESSVTRLEKAGDFPRRRKFGAGTVGWLYEEISDWAKAQGKVN